MAVLRRIFPRLTECPHCKSLRHRTEDGMRCAARKDGLRRRKCSDCGSWYAVAPIGEEHSDGGPPSHLVLLSWPRVT
jgi:hypothetical protein